MSARLVSRGRFALGAVALVALAIVPASCAAAIGLDEPGSSISELCRCDALTTEAMSQRCEALSTAKEDDVAFVRSYVSAGCPSCQSLPTCLELLGAAKDDTACTDDADCASLHCCPDDKCCSACSECSGPAPQCTPLFNAAASCLFTNHASACTGQCPAPPVEVGDACWACLEAQEAVQQKCQSQIETCLAEPPQ